MKAVKWIAVCVLIFSISAAFGYILGCIKTEGVDATIAQAREVPNVYDMPYVERLDEPEQSLDYIEQEYFYEVVEEPSYQEEVYYEPEPEYESSWDIPEDTVEYTGAVYEDGVYIEGVLTKSGGVNYYNGIRETWYSQKVLPGGGLDIPGRCVGANELIYDGDGYIVVAADDLPYGTVVETSLGMGRVYDCGVGSDNAIDIYCNW